MHPPSKLKGISLGCSLALLLENWIKVKQIESLEFNRAPCLDLIFYTYSVCLAGRGRHYTAGGEGGSVTVVEIAINVTFRFSIGEYPLELVHCR